MIYWACGDSLLFSGHFTGNSLNLSTLKIRLISNRYNLLATALELIISSSDGKPALITWQTGQWEETSIFISSPNGIQLLLTSHSTLVCSQGDVSRLSMKTSRGANVILAVTRACEVCDAYTHTKPERLQRKSECWHTVQLKGISTSHLM